MTRHVGILGYPLGHSLSPAIQQAAFDHLGIDARYEAWDVPPERLSEKVESLRSPDVLGANVTVPHKEAVMALLDSLDPWAHSVGAVNTIINRGGTLRGYNTDSDGFIQGLRDASFEASGARVLLVGAGGAARGVALALAELGVASVSIANRTLQRAERLAKELRGRIPDVKALSLEGGVLRQTALESDLIVNCTTLGMRYTPEEGVAVLTAESIPATAVAYDLVYNPLETPFLREARKAGARTVNGLTMLVHQGAASFALWMSREAPVEVMMEAASRALDVRE